MLEKFEFCKIVNFAITLLISRIKQKRFFVCFFRQSAALNFSAAYRTVQSGPNPFSLNAHCLECLSTLRKRTLCYCFLFKYRLQNLLQKYEHNNNKSKYGTFNRSKIKDVTAQPSGCSRMKVQLRNSKEQQKTRNANNLCGCAYKLFDLIQKKNFCKSE